MTVPAPTATAAALSFGALLLACSLDGAGSEAARAPGDARLVLGVYDSRAVAIAYVNSDAFGAHLDGLRAEVDALRAAGEEDRAAELEATGSTLQAELHLWTFAGAAAPELLEHLDDDARAELADAAGVDALVSRWDLAWLRGDAPVVDVTDALVAGFDPDDRTLGWIEDIRDQPLIPAEDLDHDH